MMPDRGPITEVEIRQFRDDLDHRAALLELTPWGSPFGAPRPGGRPLPPRPAGDPLGASAEEAVLDEALPFRQSPPCRPGRGLAGWVRAVVRAVTNRRATDERARF